MLLHSDKKKSGYTVEYWILRTAQKGYLHRGLSRQFTVGSKALTGHAHIKRVCKCLALKKTSMYPSKEFSYQEIESSSWSEHAPSSEVLTSRIWVANLLPPVCSHHWGVFDNMDKTVSIGMYEEATSREAYHTALGATYDVKVYWGGSNRYF